MDVTVRTRRLTPNSSDLNSYNESVGFFERRAEGRRQTVAASEAANTAASAEGRRCLRCGDGDRIVAVSAVVREGHSTTQIRGRLVGSPGLNLPFRAGAVQMSGVAQALAPPRRPMSPVVPVCAAVVAGLVELVVIQSAVAEGGRFGTGALAAVLGVGVAVFAVVAWWWRREALRRGLEVERARYLWRRSWYCSRCGVVSVFWAGACRVLGARRLAADLLMLAGELQWERRA